MLRAEIHRRGRTSCSVRREGKHEPTWTAPYRRVRAHRVVTLGGRQAEGRPDRRHVNGDRPDDRKVNLRFVTAAESSANVKVHAASGYRGVHPDKGRWPPLTTVSTEPG